MKTITVFNEKGGVGKTTLTAIIAAGLAMRGFKVLMLDADGQYDLTTSMGLPKQANFFKFVKWGSKKSPDYVDVRELVQAVPETVCENLFIVTGNNDTWGIPGSMTVRDIVQNLTLRLRLLEKVFDYVVIDTQPSATTLHDGIGLISDYVVCPTDCESFSAFGGLISTTDHMQDIRIQASAYGHSRAKVIGVIPNKYRKNVLLHQHILGKLIDGFRDENGEYELDEDGEIKFAGFGELVWEPVPLRASIPEMQLYRTVLMQDAPSLQTNEHLWYVIDRVLEATKEVESVE